MHEQRNKSDLTPTYARKEDPGFPCRRPHLDPKKNGNAPTWRSRLWELPPTKAILRSRHTSKRKQKEQQSKAHNLKEKRPPIRLLQIQPGYILIGCAKRPCYMLVDIQYLFSVCNYKAKKNTHGKTVAVDPRKSPGLIATKTIYIYRHTHETNNQTEGPSRWKNSRRPTRNSWKNARTQATPARKNNTWEHKSEDLFTQKTHQKDRVFERLHQRKYFFTQSNTCDNKVNGNNKQVTDPSL